MQQILAVHGQNIVAGKKKSHSFILFPCHVSISWAQILHRWCLIFPFPALIQACAGALPSYMVLDVAEVLWEFITFCREVIF